MSRRAEPPTPAHTVAPACSACWRGLGRCALLARMLPALPRMPLLGPAFCPSLHCGKRLGDKQARNKKSRGQTRASPSASVQQMRSASCSHPFFQPRSQPPSQLLLAALLRPPATQQARSSAASHAAATKFFHEPARPRQTAPDGANAGFPERKTRVCAPRICGIAVFKGWFPTWPNINRLFPGGFR